MSSRTKKLDKKKKGRERKLSAYDNASEDEDLQAAMMASSVAQSDDDDESGEETDLVADKMFELIDDLTEKRAATRISALRQLTSLFMSNVVIDTITDREETISDALIKCLRRGADGERIETCRALSILFLQLDLRTREATYNRFSAVLGKIANDQTLDAELRGAAITSWGFSCFICCCDPLRIKDVFTNLLELSLLDSVSISVACLRSCGLLVTCLPSHLLEEVYPEIMVEKVDLLDSPDINIRIAAGELLTVMIDNCRDINEQFDMEYETEMDKLIDCLKDLSLDRDRSKKKNETKKQRLAFREMLRFVESQEDPEESIRIGNETIRIQTVGGILHAESIKRMTGEGFHTHLAGNPMIRSIFNLPLVAPEVASRHQSHFQAGGYKTQPGKKNKAAKIERQKQRDKRRV